MLQQEHDLVGARLMTDRGYVQERPATQCKLQLRATESLRDSMDPFEALKHGELCVHRSNRQKHRRLPRSHEQRLPDFIEARRVVCG